YSTFIDQDSGYYLLDANMHSSIEILVEQGIIGFLLNSLFYGYIVVYLFRCHSVLGKYLCANVVALLIGSFFNSLTQLFFFKIYLVLTFCLAAEYNRTIKLSFTKFSNKVYNEIK
ncbi:hypothetical protein OAF50_03780, partial [bacterium]|nr:hypothetical protein [bacterium]